MFSLRSKFVFISQVLLISSIGVLTTAGTAYAQAGVYTWRNDIGRTGQNLAETTLNPSNVNTSIFGKLFSVPVDGQVYAQPLYAPNIEIPGKGSHNVIFVATQHDSVYAFDADTNGGANAIPLWQASLLDPAHGAAAGETPENSARLGNDVNPEIGISGTPVIDPATKTLYVVSKTLEGDFNDILRLHALDITTGNEKFGGPVVIQASAPGTGNGSSNGVLPLDSRWAHNRPALLLLNGIAYVGFGAHGDVGPWHGWVLAYNAATLRQTGAYCTSPNGIGGGLWMGGSGLAADVVGQNQPFGRMFVVTGNGSFNTFPPYDNSQSYGDSHIRLDLAGGVPRVTDSFTPSIQARELSGTDEDLGAGGVLVLPDQPGSHPHLLVQAGKTGILYLVDRDNMGGYGNGTDNIVQQVSGQSRGLWSTPAYWNNTIYVNGAGDNLKAFSLSNGMLSGSPIGTSIESSGYPGASPAISANGNFNAIVWTIDSYFYSSGGPAILTARDATNVGRTLYTSQQNSARDTPGPAVKFAVPTVVNGKVYVGADHQVTVYGLLNGAQQASAPSFTPGSQIFTGTISVTINNNTPGASVYYTTDGTQPTPASNLYAGPIPITGTTTIKAIASGSGFIQGPVASATYTLQTQVVTPQFSTAGGTYTSPQSVAITVGTPGATIHYTLDGTDPTVTSPVYSSPIPVNTATTMKAIGEAPGLSPSPIARATYVIEYTGTGINFGNGFSDALTPQNGLAPMTLNGSAGLNDSRLQLTNGGLFQAASAFYSTPVNIRSFSSDFTFQLSYANADGFTFAIQNNAATSIGSNAGSLGYGSGDTAGIPKSIAIKFDLYNNSGEGNNSIGLFTNGTAPVTPSIDLTGSGISLRSGDLMSVHLAYDGSNLTMNITDQATGATFYAKWIVDIRTVVGGDTAYVGFTAGTGGAGASQKILTWTYVSTASLQSVAMPVLSPDTGTYRLPQAITIQDSTPDAAIFYTTDGSIPTTSSKRYTDPIPLSSGVIVNAIAAAQGRANSVVASASYVTLSSSSSQPQPVGIDFTGLNTSPMIPGERAGVVPQANWNAANGQTSSSPLPLVDANGSTTGAAVTWSANAVWAAPIGDDPGDSRMMRGYLDTDNATTTTVTVSKLPPNVAGYDVYIYTDGDNGPDTRTGTYQISGRSVTAAGSNIVDLPGADFRGTYTQASNSGGNYVKFFVAGTDFTIVAAAANSSSETRRAPVNGIQIVPVASSGSPDFVVSASPGTATIPVTASTTFNVSVVPQNGFTGAVSLAVSGLPAGASGAFSPVSIGGGSGVSSLQVNAGSAATGTYPLLITATSGNLSHTAAASLTITAPPPDYTLNAAPVTQSVPSSGTASYNIAITSQTGFNSPVTLTATGLPSGVTATFTPPSVSGAGGTSNLQLAVNNASPGTYPFTVRATSGTLTHTVTLSLTVNATVPDFSLTTTPGTITVNSSGSGTLSLAVAGQNGFADAVALAVSGFPQGASGVFTPSTVSGGTGNSTLRITTSNVSAGTYPLTITGVNGSLQHSASALLTVIGSGNNSPSSIGIDFVGGGTSMASDESAGVVPQSNWNTAGGERSSAPLPLLNANGVSTGATITWTSNNGYATPIADIAGNVRMMRGYLDTTNTSVTTIAVSSLPAVANGYDVYVYIDGDNGTASRSASYQLSGPGIPVTTLNATDAARDFAGTFVTASNSAGNYIKFTIAGTAFTLTATPGTASDGFARAPVNGVQIVPAGSGTSLPVGIDFTGNATPMEPFEVAGIIPQSNWNVAGGNASGASLSLFDRTGKDTGATVTWTSNNTYATPTADSPGNARMMRGYLDTSNSSITRVEVSNLAPSPNGYDVYVYIDGDNPGATRTGTYQISTSGGTPTTISAIDDSDSNFDGRFVRANGTSGRFTKFTITSTNFVLTATPGASSDPNPRAPVNAIQIVATGTPLPIAVDFTGNSIAMGDNEIAGAVPQAVWNAAGGANNSTPLALRDVTGVNSGATVAWTSNNTYDLPTNDFPGNGRMMRGYLDTSTTSNTTVNFAGLSVRPNGYDIYVYGDGDNGAAARAATYRISGSNFSSSTSDLNDAAGANFNGNYALGTNYVKFSISGGDFTITAIPGVSSDAVKRAAINGVQIVPR